MPSSANWLRLCPVGSEIGMPSFYDSPAPGNRRLQRIPPLPLLPERSALALASRCSLWAGWYGVSLTALAAEWAAA